MKKHWMATATNWCCFIDRRAPGGNTHTSSTWFSWKKVSSDLPILNTRAKLSATKNILDWEGIGGHNSYNNSSNHLYTPQGLEPFIHNVRSFQFGLCLTFIPEKGYGTE